MEENFGDNVNRYFLFINIMRIEIKFILLREKLKEF